MDLTIIQQVQNEIKEWSERNFGKPYGRGYRPLLGLIEELNHELFRYIEIESGSIEDEDTENFLDALGDACIYLLDYSNNINLNIKDTYKSFLNRQGVKIISLEERKSLIHLLKKTIVHSGQLCHAHLKLEQGIRLNEDHAQKRYENVFIILDCFDAIAKNKFNLSIDIVLTSVWYKVRQRDLTKNKIDGGIE